MSVGVGVWERCGGVKKCGGRGVEECIWGGRGDCGECVGVRRSVWGGVEKFVGSPHTFLHFPHISIHTPRTHPTLLPILTQHLFHIYLIAVFTFLHTHLTSPLTISFSLPHSISLQHSPPPTLPHITLHISSHTSSQPPHLLQHFPIFTLSFRLPLTKISHFSHLLPNESSNQVHWKLLVKLYQKNLKTKTKNGNTTSKLGFSFRTPST